MAIIKREGFPGNAMSFDPAKSTDRYDFNEYEQAAFIAVLRSVVLGVLPDDRLKRAAQYLLWTISSGSCIDVSDEAINACVDGYVKWSDIEAGL